MNFTQPHIGCELTEEVLKVGDRYVSAVGTKEYKRSELETSGPFFFVKTREDED
jgi:hypothetical protein